jgi:hypothetical protein
MNYRQELGIRDLARYAVAVSMFALFIGGSVGGLAWWLARDFKIYSASPDDAPSRVEAGLQRQAQMAAWSGPEKSVELPAAPALTAVALAREMDAAEGADTAQRPRYAIVVRARRSAPPGEETDRETGRTVGELISRSLRAGY